MEVKWTEHALIALEDVFNYGKTFSLNQSADYTERLISFCDSLALFPFQSPICEELPHPQGIYRAAVYDRRYKIIYKVVESHNLLFILDIFHTSRNPKTIRNIHELE